MSTLIVVLPLETPGAATPLEYLLSPDGRTVTSHEHAVAALLPAARETVVLVPVAALSWHQVELPKGSLSRGAAGSPRLRALLEGLLEDRLLDDPASLHFALAADARAQAPSWVASCDRNWLRACLALLESVRRPAARIVPELSPGSEAQLHVLGSADAPTLVYTGPGGVGSLPWSTTALEWALAQSGADESTPVAAEPALAQQVELASGRQPLLRSSSERRLQAVAGPWDLAQFDLSASDRRRALRGVTQRLGLLARAREWRAARWGLGLLVAAHLVGVNAWAWKESAALDDKRAAVRGILTATFPTVRVVVDAPVQMGREVTLLRQASGAYSQRDLEAMLGALGAALPPGQSLQGVEFSNGEARLRGLSLNPQSLAGVNTRLQGFGLQAQAEGDRVVLRPAASNGAAP